MLFAVIYQVISAMVPVEYELALDHAAANPIEPHFHIFCVIGGNSIVGESHGSRTVNLDRILCPLGHFIYMRVWRRGTISLVVVNRAASSASAVENTKNLIIWEMVSMGILYRGLVLSLVRKMCATARIRALEKLRYTASEWAARRM